MKNIINKALLCIIIFLSLAIISKENKEYKDIINKKLYEETISFNKFEKIYNKYLGSVFPIENINTTNTLPVFNEKLNYKKITKYLDGAKLEVDQNYLIPSLENGIITYIGEKENYGKVIILETENNINIWHGNVCNSNVKLYDHLNKGDIIGETCTNELYLVYKKNGKKLNYKDYIK